VVQQSELVIERVLLGRSQTKLKEFLNDSLDPTIVCAASEENLPESVSHDVLPLVTSRYFDLVIVNKAASDVLKMSSDDQEQKLNKIPLAMAPIFRLKNPVNDTDPLPELN